MIFEPGLPNSKKNESRRLLQGREEVSHLFSVLRTIVVHYIHEGSVEHLPDVEYLVWCDAVNEPVIQC